MYRGTENKRNFQNTVNYPVSSKRYKLAWAPIGDSDQSAHMRSLIRVFDARSIGSQGSAFLQVED